MARHHVNHNTGNVGICKAAKGGCPFGGETGEDNHYDTPQEAQHAAERLMAEQYIAVNTAYRKKDTSALESMNREMKKRIISEAASGENGLHPSVVAKVFSKDNDELIRKNVSENFKSQKILNEMSNDESARVRLAVAKATNNPEILKAFANDPDINVRKAAIANGKMPVKIRKEALASLGVKYTKKDEAPAEPVQKKAEPVQQATPAPDFTPAPKVEPIATQTQQKAPGLKAAAPKKSVLPTAPQKAATLTPAQKHVKSMSDIKNSVLKNADEQTARSLSNSGVPTVFDKNFDKMSAAQKEVAVVYTYGIIHKKIGNNYSLNLSEKETINAASNRDWIASYNKATPTARKALIKEAHDNIDKALSMSSAGNTKVKEQREASDKRSRETDKYISDFTPKDPAKKKKHDKSMDDLADKMEKGYKRHAGTFSTGGSYSPVEHDGQDFKLHDHSQNNNGERFMRFSVNGDRYEMKRDKTGSWTKPKVSRD